MNATTPPEALCKVSKPLLSTVSGTASNSNQASSPNCVVMSSSVPNSRVNATTNKVSIAASRQPNTSTWLNNKPMGRCLAAWKPMAEFNPPLVAALIRSGRVLSSANRPRSLGPRIRASSTLRISRKAIIASLVPMLSARCLR